MMRSPVREFLNPHSPLVREVVSWLCGGAGYRGRVERVDGARSLAHLMVVVPTAQSGRNLRLALAREAERRGWGGVLPPKVVLPMQLVRPADESLPEAGEADVSAAFLKFLDRRPFRRVVKDEDGCRLEVEEWTHLIQPNFLMNMEARLSLLDQLQDIWRVLAGGGLLMSDVLQCERAVQVLDAAQGDEKVRWEELAALETAFFDFLHEQGLRHPSENVRLAKNSPRPFPDDVREVILPALADPIGVLKDVLKGQGGDFLTTVLIHVDASESGRFDEYGRPLVDQWTGAARPVLDRLVNEDIVLASNTTGLARCVTADFPAAGSGFAPPSLALVDEETFPEVSAAFLNAGYVVHNPGSHKLSASSLGYLIQNLSDLYRLGVDGVPWKPFVAVLRSDDFQKSIRSDISYSRADILKGIDFVQNQFLPQVVPHDGKFPDVRIDSHDEMAYAAFCAAANLLLSWLEEARRTGGWVSYMRTLLRNVFSRRMLSGGEGDVELRAAADCVREMFAELGSAFITSLELSDEAFAAIVRRSFSRAAYALEPDAPDAIKTEGWLELSWSTCEKFALVGFHEGAVPDSVMGHIFIPDHLRQALGLVSNEQRLARDTWFLTELLASHDLHAVRAYVARTNNQGDICCPSRLLYLCDLQDLANRAAYLFGDCATDVTRFPRQVVADWRLRLPDEIGLPSRDERTPEGRLSASYIDQYIRCPFTYLLQVALGMKTVEEKSELGYDDFGKLVHLVLEEYAKRQIARGDCQLTEVGAIREELEKIALSVCSVYGEHPTVNMSLQLRAVMGRIRLFADVQALWAGQGWRIVERPEYYFLVQPFADEGESVWIRGSVDRIDYHPDYGYRLIDYKCWDKKDDVTGKHIAVGGARQKAFAAKLHLPLLEDGRRLLTVQLPLYARCLECADPKFRGRIGDLCYLVLGENEENIGVYGSCCDQGSFNCSKSERSRLILTDLAPVALQTARTAIRHIRGNLFWPPGPGERWRCGFESILVDSPEKDMGDGVAEKPAWLARQLERLEACK